jgi:hypothetical protein
MLYPIAFDEADDAEHYVGDGDGEKDEHEVGKIFQRRLSTEGLRDGERHGD